MAVLFRSPELWAACRPNCGQAFHRGRLQIRALRAISPGDDLEISYVDVHEPTFVQRADLLNRYSFDLRPEVCPCLPVSLPALHEAAPTTMQATLA